MDVLATDSVPVFWVLGMGKYSPELSRIHSTILSRQTSPEEQECKQCWYNACRCVAVMSQGHTMQNDKLAKKKKNSLGTKIVLYSGKHFREKTFANFVVLRKFSL